MALREIQSDMGEAVTSQSVGSKKVLDGPPIPRRVAEFLNSIRKHQNGGIDHSHPDISQIMSRARKDKLDVVLKAEGNGVYAVTGKRIADHGKLIKVGAGAAVITATVAAGAIGFIIRKHKRSKKE